MWMHVSPLHTKWWTWYICTHLYEFSLKSVEVIHWFKGLGVATLQRPGFSSQQWCFQPHQTQLLVFTGEGSCPFSGWSVYTISCCLHPAKTREVKVYSIKDCSADTSAQNREENQFIGKLYSLQDTYCNYAHKYNINTGVTKINLQEVGCIISLWSAAPETWFYIQRFSSALPSSDSVTFWSHPHLSCFKARLPFRVWSPRALFYDSSCSKTLAASSPHIQTHQTCRGLLSCVLINPLTKQIVDLGQIGKNTD